MHLFISMLDSEEILLGSQSTVNLTFHSASYIYYCIHSPFLSLVQKKSPERVLGSKYSVVYLSCIECPPFAGIWPLRKPPIQGWFSWWMYPWWWHLMIRWSAIAGGPGPGWWLLMYSLSLSAIHSYSRYFVVTVTEGLEEECDGCSDKISLYPYYCICRHEELFRCPVCSSGIDQKQWELCW